MPDYIGSEQEATTEQKILGLDHLLEIIEQCGRTSFEHGFWNAHKHISFETLEKAGMARDDAQMAIDALSKVWIIGDPFIFLGLIGTEVSEAMEACRRGRWNDKDGVWEELADVVIRIFDFVCRFGGGSFRENSSMFRNQLLKKMAYNEGRPYLHGKKF